MHGWPAKTGGRNDLQDDTQGLFFKLVFELTALRNVREQPLQGSFPLRDLRHLPSILWPYCIRNSEAPTVDLGCLDEQSGDMLAGVLPFVGIAATAEADIRTLDRQLDHYERIIHPAEYGGHSRGLFPVVDGHLSLVGDSPTCGVFFLGY